MQYGNPFTSLHEAIAAACYCDLPDVEYTDRDWASWRDLTPEQQKHAINTNTVPTLKKKRRPYHYEVEVTMFDQMWPSTALGYGGIGGAAITNAYTVIVGDQRGNHCVYFGCGSLAYMVNIYKLSQQGLENFKKDLGEHNMADVDFAKERYV